MNTNTQQANDQVTLLKDVKLFGSSNVTRKHLAVYLTPGVLEGEAAQHSEGTVMLYRSYRKCKKVQVQNNKKVLDVN